MSQRKRALTVLPIWQPVSIIHPRLSLCAVEEALLPCIEHRLWGEAGGVTGRPERPEAARHARRVSVHGAKVQPGERAEMTLSLC